MEFKIVGAKVASKKEAQRAYREIEEAEDAGTTDYQEVLGIWKNDKGKFSSKYYGSHARALGTGVGALLGPAPAAIGYFVGKHYMPKGKILTPFMEDLAETVDHDGAAIFVLAPEEEVDSLVETITSSLPGVETVVLDPDDFSSDIATLEEEAKAGV